MVDQSKALPKVGMPELKFSVISDTWSHSKARYRVSGLMVSDQHRMRLPQNLGQIHDEENNLDVLVFCAGIERSMAFYRYALACAVDRKSTRLNSSHSQISYAVFCLKKKKIHRISSSLMNV